MTSRTPALAALLLQLDTMVWKLGRDEPISGDAYSQLLGVVNAVGPSLDQPDRVQLAGGVQRLVAALREGSSRLDQKLAVARAGRRAVKAYAGQASPR